MTSLVLLVQRFFETVAALDHGLQGNLNLSLGHSCSYLTPSLTPFLVRAVFWTSVLVTSLRHYWGMMKPSRGGA